MKINRLITALLITLTVSITAIASETPDSKQRPFPEDKVEYEAHFFIESLKLSGDSANRFIEIFTDYSREIHNALETHKATPPGQFKNKQPKPSQEQIDKNIKARFACSRAILNIRENFYHRFREVLSPSQYEAFTMLEQKIGAKKRHEHERRRIPKQTKDSKKSNKKK